MVFPKVSVPRLSDTIARQLEARILEGSLKPGDRLQPERELAQELGVSRPSLREAIQKLVSRGLLNSRQGGGTFVTDRLDAAFADPWQALIDTHPTLQGDLFEFRFVIEAAAAGLAAERATDADLASLGNALDRLDAAYHGDDRASQVAADVDFHQAVAEASHNALFGHLTASLLKLIHDHVRRNNANVAVSENTALQLMAQHRAIFEAIVARRPEAARAASEAHIAYVRRRFDEAAQREEWRESALRRLG